MRSFFTPLALTSIAVILSFVSAEAADISFAQAKKAAGKWLDRHQRPLNATYGTFDTLSSIVYNVYPSGTGELVTGRVLTDGGQVIVGATVAAYMTTGVSATDGTSTDYVNLTWSAATYATSYELWRGTDSASTFATRLASGITALSYQDVTATPGVTYYYWVKSVNAVGTSDFSDYDVGMRGEVSDTTTTTPVSVPYTWLDGYGLVFGGDYEAAGFADWDGDGYSAWEEYVAGTVSTNIASLFLSEIMMVNGVPVIEWSPDLGSERTYTLHGKTNLLDPVWVTPTNSSTRFFRVGVDVN